MDIHSLFFPSKRQCYLYDPSGQGNRLDTSFRCTRRTALGHSTPCSQCCLALPSSVRQSWRCGHRIVTWRKNDVIEVVPKFCHPILIESLFVSHWFWEEEMAWEFFSFHSSFQTDHPMRWRNIATEVTKSGSKPILHGWMWRCNRPADWEHNIGPLYPLVGCFRNPKHLAAVLFHIFMLEM